MKPTSPGMFKTGLSDSYHALLSLDVAEPPPFNKYKSNTSLVAPEYTTPSFSAFETIADPVRAPTVYPTVTAAAPIATVWAPAPMAAAVLVPIAARERNNVSEATTLVACHTYGDAATTPRQIYPLLHGWANAKPIPNEKMNHD